jgi:hypothetical protein
MRNGTEARTGTSREEEGSERIIFPKQWLPVFTLGAQALLQWKFSSVLHMTCFAHTHVHLRRLQEAQYNNNNNNYYYYYISH